MKTRQDFILFVGAIFILFNACSTATSSQKEMISKTEIEEEKYRPSFHFTPENNWMNDPNGMFYLNGTFHLIFNIIQNQMFGARCIGGMLQVKIYLIGKNTL